MKIPEPLFKLINLIVIALLKSPIHGLWSTSLMVIGFTGRKSGSAYRTPVRYLRKGKTVQCFTSKTGKWWRNIEASQQATLLLGGEQSVFAADVVIDQPERIRTALMSCLAQFPQDGVYHDIRIDSDNKPISEDVERELPGMVLIEFTDA